MSVGNQEQLAVGVDSEETQELVDPASYKISDSRGLGLRHGLAPREDLTAAVKRYPAS